MYTIVTIHCFSIFLRSKTHIFKLHQYLVNWRFCSQRKLYPRVCTMSLQENVLDPSNWICVLFTLSNKSRHIASKSFGILDPSWKNYPFLNFVPWIHTSILEPLAIGAKHGGNRCVRYIFHIYFIDLFAIISIIKSAFNNLFYLRLWFRNNWFIKGSVIMYIKKIDFWINYCY